MSRPSVDIRRTGDHSRVVEVMFPDGQSCLIMVTWRPGGDPQCIVDVYRADPSIEVRATADPSRGPNAGM
jgi:hypothetical protein